MTSRRLGGHHGAREAGTPEPRSLGADARRPIIVHYHCYKNAGASLIHSARATLGRPATMEIDKHPTYKDWRPYRIADIETIAAENPDVHFFTAHSIAPEIHHSTRYNAIPLIFVRHPLLRIASSYRFDRQRRDRPHKTQLAMKLDLAAWIAHQLDDTQTIEGKNYQAIIFALGQQAAPPDNAVRSPATVDLSQVFAQLDTVPFVGVVEHFGASAARLETLVRPHFPAFAVSKSANRTKLVEDWQAEVAHLEASLPPRLLARFREANEQDYAIHERYLERFEAAA